METSGTRTYEQQQQRQRRVDEEEEGMKQGVREGSSSSYRLMVCSRIGLVDRRLNWVSVQSPTNTSSTASPRLARESEKRVEATND